MPALRTETDGICYLKTNEDFIVFFLEIFDWEQNPFQQNQTNFGDFADA